MGAAVRLSAQGGAALYQQIVGLWGAGPMERADAVALANSMGGAANRPRLALFLTLCEQFLSRLARAGVMGLPTAEAAPQEHAVLARLSPHDAAAKAWAQVTPEILARARHGLAVNLDPGAVVLDMLGAMERTARQIG